LTLHCRQSHSLAIKEVKPGRVGGAKVRVAVEQLVPRIFRLLLLHQQHPFSSIEQISSSAHEFMKRHPANAARPRSLRHSPMLIRRSPISP